MIKLAKNKSYNFLLIHANDISNIASPFFLIPCIESICNEYPNAHINILIHSSARHLFANNPFVSNIICLDLESNLKRTIKCAKIDISISFVTDKNISLMLFMLGIKIRIGVFANLHSLLFNYKIKQQRFLSKKHEAQYNLDLLKIINCKHANKPSIYITLQEKHEARLYLESILSANRQNTHIDISNLIMIYPSGYGSTYWSSKHFFTLANLLAKDYPVLILSYISQIASHKIMLEGHENLSNDNLMQIDSNNVLGIVSYAHLFIGNNSAMLHCANALEIKTIGIYPCTKQNNPIRYGIFSNKNITITPYGTFSYKEPQIIAAYLAQNDLQGGNIDTIQPELIYNIAKKQY